MNPFTHTGQDLISLPPLGNLNQPGYSVSMVNQAPPIQPLPMRPGIMTQVTHGAVFTLFNYWAGLHFDDVTFYTKMQLARR